MDIEEQNLRDAADKCICDCSDTEFCTTCSADTLKMAVVFALVVTCAWVAGWVAVGLYVGEVTLHHIK